ncbi:hypothetical protein [Paenibacillus mucilaginosus]|uniref:Uncharacterized protein n=1 Tax=Paenibacillus mucilaginosus (strain KNP414) TaxID=1036673 RepID=F8FI49_PAEMK|nr:hypothetical protein [Paenibacillus mucilaginosus]AEI43952.1 hypothetical protein KNP414_05428 [Paenibacillus mucilaginosus KNP414]MCG7212550.1 hypothetical protein [Paenibacillus mucilaginosus]WDM25421.1 hypothetical protein KCX80_23550 [Paenibacillus mucilaginosus]
MEKRLVKGAVYSFVIGICLAILFIPEWESFRMPLREYVFRVLRFGIMAMFGTVIALWLLGTAGMQRGEIYEFVAGVVKSFVVVSLFIVLVAVVANLVR